MQFNVDKCKVMHIGKHNPEFKYSMANTELETVQEEKDLGVLISEDLKPSAHYTHSYIATWELFCSISIFWQNWLFDADLSVSHCSISKQSANI